MSRFDYVRYDEYAQSEQAVAKDLVTKVETFILSLGVAPRAKSIALTKLEEVYMWIGKAIRDDQIERNDGAELQEERGNE
jgi:hypothetical protein